LAAKESLVICKSDRVGLQVFERETRGAQKTGGGQKKNNLGSKKQGGQKTWPGVKKNVFLFFYTFLFIPSFCASYASHRGTFVTMMKQDAGCFAIFVAVARGRLCLITIPKVIIILQPASRKSFFIKGS
jgi:hypothetical protein